jgi:hypothetical protein
MKANTIEGILARLIVCEPDVLDTGCWLWPGRKCAGGYGQVSTPTGFKMVHRWVYEHFCGPIPEGKELDHLCRRRNCANWQHHEPVTHRTNVRRGASMETKTRCVHGHAYEGANIGWTGGHRVCRACARHKSAAYRARKKAQQAESP